VIFVVATIPPYRSMAFGFEDAIEKQHEHGVRPVLVF
jgi:hypothetical protein